MSKLGAILKTAETYFNVAYDPSDSIIYKSTHGLYSDIVDPSTGKKSIVCSQFAQACMEGIEFKNSRYSNGYASKNKSLWWGWNPLKIDGINFCEEEPWSNDYLTAAGQYNYFKKLGVLNEYNSEHNNILPGDLIFLDTLKNNSIGHVVICLRVYNTSMTIIHSTNNKHRLIDGKEVGVVCETINMNSFPILGYVHLSDIIKADVDTTNTLVYSNQSTGSKIFNTKSTVYLCSCKESLEKGFYTVNINTDKYDGYIKVYYSNGKQVNYGAYNMCGCSSIVFYAEMPITKIDFRMSDGEYNKKFNFNGIKMYKGYAQAN